MYIEETKEINGIPITMIGYEADQSPHADIITGIVGKYRFSFHINNGRMSMFGFNEDIKVPLNVQGKYIPPRLTPYNQRTDTPLDPVKMLRLFHRIKNLVELVSLLEEFQGEPLRKAPDFIESSC